MRMYNYVSNVLCAKRSVVQQTGNYVSWIMTVLVSPTQNKTFMEHYLHRKTFYMIFYFTRIHIENHIVIRKKKRKRKYTIKSFGIIVFRCTFSGKTLSRDYMLPRNAFSRVTQK